MFVVQGKILNLLLEISVPCLWGGVRFHQNVTLKIWYPQQVWEDILYIH